jgi:hypothetical protein
LQHRAGIGFPFDRTLLPIFWFGLVVMLHRWRLVRHVQTVYANR